MSGEVGFNELQSPEQNIPQSPLNDGSLGELSLIPLIPMNDENNKQWPQGFETPPSQSDIDSLASKALENQNQNNQSLGTFTDQMTGLMTQNTESNNDPLAMLGSVDAEQVQELSVGGSSDSIQQTSVSQQSSSALNLGAIGAGVGSFGGLAGAAIMAKVFGSSNPASPSTTTNSYHPAPPSRASVYSVPDSYNYHQPPIRPQRSGWQNFVEEGESTLPTPHTTRIPSQQHTTPRPIRGR